jgi:hypothetical protein
MPLVRLWPNWTGLRRNTAARPEDGAPQNPRPDRVGWSLRGRLLFALTIALIPVAAVIVLQGMERARLDTENIRERLIQSAHASATDEQNIVASAEQRYAAMLALAEGRLDASEFATWLRTHLRVTGVHEPTTPYVVRKRTPKARKQSGRKNR